MIRRTPDFEVAVEPDANIVCFRFAPPGRDHLDLLQAKVRRDIVADGSFYLVQAQLPRGLHLRTTLVNPFTSEADLLALLEAVRAAGK